MRGVSDLGLSVYLKGSIQKSDKPTLIVYTKFWIVSSKKGFLTLVLHHHFYWFL